MLWSASEAHMNKITLLLLLALAAMNGHLLCRVDSAEWPLECAANLAFSASAVRIRIPENDWRVLAQQRLQSVRRSNRC